MKLHNQNCDGSHCVSCRGEIRILPTGGEANALLCKSCYLHEMEFRKQRNRELGSAFAFKTPEWEDLEVYLTT